MSMSNKDKIKGFIKNELLPGSDIEYSTSLFRDQLLDSLSLGELIAFLEESFGIKIAAMEIAYENLDTVNNIDSFIAKKQKEAA